MPLKEASLELIAKHLNSLGNKDKVIKIVQYGAQALLHYVYKDPNNPTTKRVEKLFWSLVLHRKLFRYLFFLNEMVNIRDRMRELASEDDKVDKISSALLLGKNSAFFVFWLLDNAVYLSMGKLAHFNGGPAAMLSYKLWFAASICSLARNFRLYLSAGDKEQEEEQLLRVVQDLADIVVSLGFSKMADPHITWGHIGFAGIASAVLQLRLTWPKTK
mmetsp:Transcript_27314/g.52964  ORF Transcript_27314/g.52964 Transcript_27314/m.52964 type:complete len:217 (-) Transcript_27314:165-815(-)